MRFFYRKQTQRGFTLVEMIVAIFVFSIVMVIATGTLISILEANRKAQAVKSVMNNLNFALDSMTRSIRVGTSYDCGVGNCASEGSSRFFFVDTDGRVIEYRRGGTRIERSINGSVFAPLTAPEVRIDHLTFYLDGTDSGDREQPRVLIVLKGVAAPGERSQTEFSLETLITQRLLDR